MRILFATDGSSGSIAAARFLSRLGHHRDVHIHLLTARDTGDTNDGTEILDSTQRALGTFPGHVTRALFHADSTSEIVDGILCTADYVAADLIVVGARGRTGLTRFLLGSVAEAVARHSTVPVLVGRLPEFESETPATPTTVLVGVDGSLHAHQAAQYAARTFPLPPDALLRLANVVQPPPWADYPDLLAVEGVGKMVEENMANTTQHSEAVLANLSQELEAEGASVVTEIAYGDPATELLDLAGLYNADLIAIGSRGLSGIERFLLGCVSDRVLWHAPCSVLVCRFPTAQDAA